MRTLALYHAWQARVATTHETMRCAVLLELRYERRRRGLTVGEFAQLLGVSGTHYTALESGTQWNDQFVERVSDRIALLPPLTSAAALPDPAVLTQAHA
ncbi:MAG: hypothetical protein JWO05_1168 [Gemmatimonadetes bacterium]|nr:hypothetical protein [Gemmatimonadota bacterium]